MKKPKKSGETRFKKWCVENGHTSLEISERVGISRQAVYSYMEGRRVPSRNTQKRFEEAYDVSMRDLFPL